MKQLPDRPLISIDPTEDPSEAEANCIKALSKATGHKQAVIVDNGSLAIYTVFSAINGGILIPDQGIWNGTTSHAANLGMPLYTLPTELGIVNPETLDGYLSKNEIRAFFLTSFAGYIAKQELEPISRICRDHGVLLIEDASGSIGGGVLADARFSDVIVGSARAPKLLNLEKGGFITTDREGLLEELSINGSQLKADTFIHASMINSLKSARTVLERLIELSGMLKDSLEPVVHRDRQGPCVGLFADNSKQAARNALKDGFKTLAGRAILTPCPRFDRFLERGLVVELKKLDIASLDYTDITAISDYLKYLINSS